VKYRLHAEDIGWPPKKTGKNINANKKAEIIAVDFSPAMAMAA